LANAVTTWALLGAGYDAFVWNPGDGNDTVEGQDGYDKLVFNGANISENIDISANGGRVRFSRDVANVTMDLNGVEQVTFHAFGGADNIVINDVSGTDLHMGTDLILGQVQVDLESALGSGVGDGQVDTVTVNGTAGDDAMNVVFFNGWVGVGGAPTLVNINHAEATDQLVINGGGGADVIDASALNAGTIGLTLNGGAGADTLIGSQGDDIVNGGTGNDVALLGAGNDAFIWNPGDGSDTIEGQAGFDSLVFNGANVNEHINIFANGGRVDFSRDIANVTMDMNGTEKIDFHALGGADTVTVNDLSGTDITQIDIDLAAAGGGGDGQTDTIIINATNGDDVILISGDSSGITILGLAAQVNVSNFDAFDQIIINGLSGDDVIEASGLAAVNIQLTANGDDGNDVLIGSAGDDTLAGGPGDDVLIGGPGLDILNGGAGDNILIQ
jgi:Ca2+-binding RTX toxin-like protein